MAKSISMEDIAKKLGLSRNAISLAIRGMPGLSTKTRGLIMDTAKQMGYVYKKADASADEITGSICIILSGSTPDSMGFFSSIQYGIEDEAKRYGYNTVISYFNEDRECIDTPISIKNGLISGIVTLGRVTEKNMHTILGYGLPVVMIDHYIDNLRVDCTLTDNQCSAYTAVEYLISCGHNRIGFAGNISCNQSFYDRYHGYLKCLSFHNIPAIPEYVLNSVSLEKLSLQSIKPAVDVLETLNPLPTAFFCCNDIEAITMIKAFNSMGLKVPSDISVMGFDDIEPARNTIPELTTMRVEKEYTGRRAVQRLLSRFENSSLPCEKMLLSTNLIERQSVRKITQP